MDSVASKISFIPKTPLAHEERFFERKRPRSVMGVIAGTVLTISVGLYAGLYYWNIVLAEKIITKTNEINELQGAFTASPYVSEAKMFRSRADLAKELLSQHIVISPIFDFISEATLQDVLYESFAFSKSDAGWTLELAGEAPSYAVLAYQSDILKKKTEELDSFAIKNVALTRFGTVHFSLSLVFAPEYISYTKNISTTDELSSIGVATPTSSMIPESPSEEPSINVVIDIPVTTEQAESGEWTVASEQPTVNATTSTTTSRTQEAVGVGERDPSKLQLLWSKFKFW